MRLLLLCSMMVVGVVHADGEDELDAEYKEETHERIRYLERQANTYNHLVRKLSAELQDLLTEVPEAITVSCAGPDEPLNYRVDPEWQSADAPQRAHDAGYQLIYVIDQRPGVCGPIEITRDGVHLAGDGSTRFGKISVLGADNIYVADAVIEELEMVSSSLRSNDFNFARGKVINSNAYFSYGNVVDTKFTGSTVEFGPGAVMNGDIEFINSSVEFTGGVWSVRGRLILRGGSYVDADWAVTPSYSENAVDFWPEAQLICDPQTSRILSAYPLGVQPNFQPPQTGSETCIISQPYE